jgi:hypothetical protein
MVNSLAGSGAHLQPNIPHTPQPSNELKTPTKVRNVFPETWLWTNESVGLMGMNICTLKKGDKSYKFVQRNLLIHFI